MPDGSRLPGIGDDRADDEERIVLHVDADCFYASCERLREPDLEGEPVVVGMGYESGETTGAVATASYEARAHGVESAQAISTALERLPRRADYDPDADSEHTREETGHYRPVDMDYYESIAEEVRTILHDCADVVREVSIDEAYLDVTDRTAWEVADGFARHVTDRIQREVGVTVSIGVAPTMSAAKIASDFDKPNGITVVRPGDVRDFLDPLEVELLHGVGPVTARELRGMGLETAGDVAATDPEPLVDAFGERGRELYDRARGDDDRRVEPKGEPKSFSRESAFASPVDEPEPKRDQIRTLAEAVADRAQREDALYRTIGVKAVTPPYDVHTRENSLPGPVDEPDLVEELALELFEEFESEPVRKLGVRIANLEFAAGDQTSLEGWDSPVAEADASSSPSSPSSSSSSPTLSSFSASNSTVESADSDVRTGAESTTDEREPPDADAQTETHPREHVDGQTSLEDFP
ncbi:DNA polymerase IV [Natronoglomus mannanivorans]|uniref:DNA polymerase IV n=1 Tax=Natronoglomus mannanivorans TaxID=2979990 RepID=A0AAP3E245_9EURY|nr:DNA polymerase IV [Halobacteria archaeon AArc-xg1-1]